MHERRLEQDIETLVNTRSYVPTQNGMNPGLILNVPSFYHLLLPRQQLAFPEPPKSPKNLHTQQKKRTFSEATKLELLAPPVSQNQIENCAKEIYEVLLQKHRSLGNNKCKNYSHIYAGYSQITCPKVLQFSKDVVKKCKIQEVFELYLDFDLMERFMPNKNMPNLLVGKMEKKFTNNWTRKKVDFVKGKRSRSETGYFGVRLSTSGYRFRATVNFMGKPHNAGTYATVEEAARKYDEKLLELSGGYVDSCRLNMPPPRRSLKRPYDYMEHGEPVSPFKKVRICNY